MNGLPGLKDARRRAGLTQEELAAKAALSAQSIYFYESGRANPSHKALERLADVLGCTLDELAGRRAS